MRKRKIPISEGANITRADLALDWPRIEATYGHPLPADVRHEIETETLNVLMAGSIMEKNAASVESAYVAVRNIRKTAVALQESIPPISEPLNGNSYARNLLFNNLWDGRMNYDARPVFNDPIEGILQMLAGLVSACDAAHHTLNDPNYSRAVGEAWDRWVVRITAILDRRDLPTGARHNDSDEPASPFVALVKTFQGCLPDGFSRHQHSDLGLAKAINRARQKLI